MQSRVAIFLTLFLIVAGGAIYLVRPTHQPVTLESIRTSASPEILMDMPTNRGINDFGKLTEGMNLTQVMDTLEAEVVEPPTAMEHVLKGPETIVKCFNPDGSSIVLMFRYEKLASKHIFTTTETLQIKPVE